MKLSEKEKQSLFDRAKKKAQDRQGQCLSDGYTNARSPMEWKCSNPAHASWTATYRNVVLHGTWCPHCKNDSQAQLQKAHQTAQEHDGALLSGEYMGSKGKLNWQCSHSHKWTASFSSVVHQGSWCPKCKHENHHKNFQQKKEKGDKK